MDRDVYKLVAELVDYLRDAQILEDALATCFVMPDAVIGYHI